MKKFHFEAEIAFPKFSEVRDTVKIPKRSDLMIGGNIHKRRLLERWHRIYGKYYGLHYGGYTIP